MPVTNGGTMLVCGCGRWMHTQGVEECFDESGSPLWLVRFECRACGWSIGLHVPPSQGGRWVDRLMWTDEARHVLDRMPPYARVLVRDQVEKYVRTKGEHVVTFDLQSQARHGLDVTWDPEAENRLANVPAPVRAMAKMELERTAADSGNPRVTVGLMEQVKARYFGMGARNPQT